jgi:hypothetical protein
VAVRKKQGEEQQQAPQAERVTLAEVLALLVLLGVPLALLALLVFGLIAR